VDKGFFGQRRIFHVCGSEYRSVTPSYEKALLLWHGFFPTPFSPVQDVKNPKPRYKALTGIHQQQDFCHQTAEMEEPTANGKTEISLILSDEEKEENYEGEDDFFNLGDEEDSDEDLLEEITITKKRREEIAIELGTKARKQRIEGEKKAAKDTTLPKLNEPVIALFWRQTGGKALFPSKDLVWKALSFAPHDPEKLIQALEPKRNRMEISITNFGDYEKVLRNVLDTAGRIATMVNAGEMTVRRTFDNLFCGIRIQGLPPNLGKEDILKILFDTCNTPTISLENIEKMNTDKGRDAIVILKYQKVPFHFLALLLDEIKKKDHVLAERKMKDKRTPTILNVPYLRMGSVFLKFSINVPPQVYQEKCPHCAVMAGENFLVCHKENLCPLPDVFPDDFKRTRVRPRRASNWRRPLDLEKIWTVSPISMNAITPSMNLEEANKEATEKSLRARERPNWSSSYKDQGEKGGEPATKRHRQG
jgi:hypothetical protein